MSSARRSFWSRIRARRAACKSARLWHRWTLRSFLLLALATLSIHPRKNISPQLLQLLKSGGQQHAHVEASRHDMREITAAPALHRPVCAKFVWDHSTQGPVVRLNPSSKPYSNNCSTPEVTTPHTNALQSPPIGPVFTTGTAHLTASSINR